MNVQSFSHAKTDFGPETLEANLFLRLSCYVFVDDPSHLNEAKQ